MRLYLSSFDIGNFPEKLTGLFTDAKPRIGIIMNALDHAPRPRAEWLLKNQTNLSSLGFECEEIDLRDFFNEQITEAYLKKFDGVWVNGGNVFILERAFEQSGFKNILADMLDRDTLVYAGFSAALYVISPTLRGADLVDDPALVPEGYKPDFSWEGMAILPMSIAVHYQSDHHESEDIDKEISYYKEHNIPFEVLRDGEVYLVQGEAKEFLRI